MREVEEEHTDQEMEQRDEDHGPISGSDLAHHDIQMAKFEVTGSTGSTYQVTLSTGRHTCHCMDFRVRYIQLALQCAYLLISSAIVLCTPI